MKKIEIEKDTLEALIRNSTELAWAAGIVDGEGSICIIKEKRKNNYSTQYRLRLSVGMTHEDTVRKLQSIFNLGNVRCTPNHKTHPKWRPVYEWVVLSKQAQIVLNILFPFMVTKRENALVAEAFSNRTRSKPGYGNKVSKQLMDEREALYKKMRSLNPKGASLCSN